MRLEDSDVVHEHVQAAESHRRLVDHPANSLGVAEVGSYHHMTVARQGRRDVVCSSGMCPVVHPDPIPGCMEYVRDRGADSSRRTGYECRATGARHSAAPASRIDQFHIFQSGDPPDPLLSDEAAGCPRAGRDRQETVRRSIPTQLA